MFKGWRDILRAPIKSNNANRDAPLNPSASDSGSQLLLCEFCNDEWQSETEMYYHKKEHFKLVQRGFRKGELYCWSCMKKFENRQQLIDHIRPCHLLTSKMSSQVERNIYVCDYCHNVFFNKAMLTAHISHIHPKSNLKGLRECPICFKNITRKNLWAHFRTHNMVSICTCRICYEHCNTWEELHIHINCHSKDLRCRICNRKYDTTSIYESHVKTDHPTLGNCLINMSDEKKELLVKKYFVNKLNIPIYTNLQPYRGYKVQEVRICVMCKEICENLDDSVKHVFEHKSVIPPEELPPENKNKFVCFCGQLFDQNILFKQHSLKHEMEAKKQNVLLDSEN